MIPLPIDPRLPDITAALAATGAVVVVAEPGAGKTSRVPPAILRAGLLNHPHQNLILLQPRRVAARAAAARLAEENLWTLGREVGYHVRFEKRLTPATRLRVLTEGLLTRLLLDDPYLDRTPGIGCVVLDEFHERSLHTDLALAILNELRRTVRPDLLIVVMSATLDAQPVAAFLGTPDRPCPIVQVPGRSFPVEIIHAPAASARTAAPRDALIDHTAKTILHELRTSPGDLLVFLPGGDEIRRTAQRLPATPDTLVVPLYGNLPWEQQLRALEPAPPGQRKIILATNIAETSLTIEGVRTVIDTGLARVASFDPDRGLDRLDLARISHASSTQRAGRAGRTAPGRCVRLWSAQQDRLLEDFQTPEIKRVDLASTVLTLHAFGHTDPQIFTWFEPPPEESLIAAQRLLELLGALTPSPAPKITPLGRALLPIPVHPRLARLLLAATHAGLPHEGAALAALLEEKDIFTPTRTPGPRTVAPSDLLLRLAALEEARPANFASARTAGLNSTALHQALRARDQLLSITKSLILPPTAHHNPTLEDSPDTLLKLILYAYPDRVVRRRPNDPAAGVMVGGSGVRLDPQSCVWQGDFYLALLAQRDHRAKNSHAAEALVRIASHIEESWLEEMFPDEIRSERSVEFDEPTQRVVPLQRIFYRDLLLREDRHGPLDPAQVQQVLAAALRPRAAAIFQSDHPAAALLARLAFLRRALPELPWPTLDHPQLADLLASATPGKRSLDELRPALANLLRSTLPYPLDRRLDSDAPETIPVHSGSRIRIQYPPPAPPGQPDAPPILPVRLRDLFGLADTPRIAAGRVPLLLHLLAPNFRPVQITADLRSFWKTAYFQVRKDLRVRYPKHAWPEDPLSAPPQAKGTRHRH